jgi:hypothetical protein
MEAPLSNLERGPNQEQQAERTSERRDYEIQRPVITRQTPPAGPVPNLPSEVPGQAVPTDETPRVKEIKGVLSEDLTEVYANMPEANKQAFRVKGAQTVKQIDGLLGGIKVQAGKIADLIRRWLVLIPGINKFFLEQEIKIKTDKILNLKK